MFQGASGKAEGGSGQEQRLPAPLLPERKLQFRVRVFTACLPGPEGGGTKGPLKWVSWDEEGA